MTLGNNTILFDCLNIRRGGGVTVACRLIDRFAVEGWDVTVLTATQSVSDAVVDIGFENVTVVQKLHLASQAKCLWFRHFGFSGFAKDLNIDLLFTFNYWTPFDGRQVTYHINATPFFKSSEIRKLVGVSRSIVQPYYSRMAIVRSTANLFESDYVLGLAKQKYRRISNPIVRYIGIDIPEVKPSRVENKPKIVTITSGGAHKRNDLVIDLHRRLKAGGHDVLMIIGGSKDAIESSLSARDLEYTRTTESVRFIGYVSREKLYHELCNSTALVSCSEVESFFMVPLEAMSVGCPAICSRISSIDESVGDAGIVTDAGDLDAMEEWFVKLLDEETRKHWSEKSIAWAEKFSADECSREIYDSVVELM